MVKIRLARHAKKNDPFYRLVAIHSQRKRSGKALEILGHWHPQSGLKKIDTKKIQDWVKKGAQISPGVQKLLNQK